MNNARFRKFGIAAALLLLVLLVGCQSVGGVDLNAVLSKQQDVQSSEASGSLEVALDWDEEAFAYEDEEAVRLLHQLSRFKLVFHNVKEDGQGGLLAKGTLSFGKGDVPFTIHADSKAALVEVDGAKRPFAVDLASGETEFAFSSAIEDSANRISRKLFSYVVTHLPNPADIRTSKESVPINGVATDLTKVSAKLNGRELGDLIPVFIDSVLQDEEGLRAVLKEFILWTQDVSAEAAAGQEDEWRLTEAEIDGQVQEAIDSLKEARKELDRIRTDEESGWSDLFSDGASLAFDAYVDASLQIRKLSAEAKIDTSALSEDSVPLRGVTIRLEEENWNLNADLAIPAVNVPRNALTEKELDTMSPVRLVRTFETDSVLYDLLKNDLQIDDQEVWLSSYWGDSYFYDKDEVLYIPVRETVSGFYDTLVYDQAKRSINFYDEATYRSVSLKPGSAWVTVDGKAVKWSRPVVSVDGLAYAPADELLGLLGATYSFEEDEDGDSWLWITRDL